MKVTLTLTCSGCHLGEAAQEAEIVLEALPTQEELSAGAKAAMDELIRGNAGCDRFAR